MITFEHVTKSYLSGTVALDDVSFEITPGEFTAITGESGAGKTTIMRLLVREIVPTNGKIIFNGREITNLKKSLVPQLRRQLSIVFQDYKLLPELTVEENISLPLEIIGLKSSEILSRVKDVLSLVALEDKLKVFPSQLSGGEAQRVGIARALVVGPKVIFADEPTGNLDPESSQAIAKLLKKINSLGPTIIVATHDPEIVKHHATRVLRLQKGKLIEDKKIATKKDSEVVEKESKEKNHGEKEENREDKRTVGNESERPEHKEEQKNENT